MSEKEFEMSDEYKLSLERLMKAINERDRLLEYVNSRPFPPQVRAQKLQLIGQLTKQIEKFEKAIAGEYEITQEKFRAEEKLDTIYEELDEMTDEILPELLAYLAEHNPEVHAKLVADLERIDKENEDEDE